MMIENRRCPFHMAKCYYQSCDRRCEDENYFRKKKKSDFTKKVNKRIRKIDAKSY